MESQSTGKKLVYQRKIKGYTQNKLSEKSEVAIRTIQRIEKDEVKPQLQTLLLLANALEIEVDELSNLKKPIEEKPQNKWLLFLHGSPFLGFIFPFSVLFPLFLWIHKREDNSIYYQHGIKIINFQLSITILHIIAITSLVTIERWGFFFFIAVVPFNFFVITFNIFRAITSQKCYYPLSFPFLKQKLNKRVSKRIISLLTITLLLISGCSSNKEKSEYEILLEYEGTYEYINNTTLELKASPLDTILYAVIDNAKYPLKRTALDSFTNRQGNLVVFNRNESKKVINYLSGDQFYKLITTNINKGEMFPRKELFHNPENYRYKQPTDINDGLKTGVLEDQFKNPELIINMVKETIQGKFPDVHSILIYKNNKLVVEEYLWF